MSPADKKLIGRELDTMLGRYLINIDRGALFSTFENWVANGEVIEEQVIQGVQRVVAEWGSSSASAQLCADELCLLGGGIPIEIASETGILISRVERCIREEKLYQAALPAHTVSDLLHIGEDQVCQLQTTDNLFGISGDVGVRFPEFQFYDGGTIPALAQLLPLMEGWNPLTVERFFLTVDPDLAFEDGVAVSRRDWLIRGGSVDRIRVAAALP